MKNIHKMLILFVSFVFAASAVWAQSDLSPKLKDQQAQKTKALQTVQEAQQAQQMEVNDMAPTPEQMIQQRMELDGSAAYPPPKKSEGLSGPTDSFCAPSYTNGCDFGDGFTDFVVEEIENLNSGCEDNTGTPGWSEYYSLGPATLVPGFVHTFSFTVGFSSQYVNIWIDFDDDEILTADEIILQDFDAASSGTWYDVDITIPANATPGEHAMRAMTVYASTFTDPCGSYTYGEAEDYTVFIATPEYGDLEGFVTENTGGAAIEGAVIELASGLFTATSGADGYYSISDVLVGDWTIDVTKAGYNPYSDMVTIEDGMTTQHDVPMTQPTMEIDPLSIDVTIDPFGQLTEMIDISNNGDGPLHWSAQLELLTEGGDDMWDVIFDVPVGVGGGEAGIETDGVNIYTSKWNGTGEFYRYDMAGNLIETINVAGSTGCRDIAFDGTYFYGGAASTTIFEMDLANATMISTFTGPAACRAIAYNEDLDIFYCNNWSDNITKFDKSGASLGSFPVGPIGVSYYGFAYDNYSEPGTPYLWGYAQTGATLNEIVQTDLGTEMETGFSLDMGTLVNVGTGIAGGLGIHTGVAPGVYAMIGTAQNVNLWAVEFAPAGPVWLSINPSSGDVDPGNMEQMDVMFDATDIVAGTVKTANIHFMSDPDVGMVTVPVSMTVGDLDFGTVEGTVTLDGSAPYNIGDVTEVLVQVGPYSGYPDASGFYSIQVYPGTYDASATLYGYEMQTVADVVVDEGLITTVDFTMPCLYGIVSGTVTAVDGGGPVEGATVMLVDTEFETTTAADGTYEIIVEAGTYDVKVSAQFFGSQTAEDVVIDAEMTTTLDFALETLEGVIVVIDLDPTPNPQITDVIQGFFPGGLVEYTTSITEYPLDEEVQTVFLLLGIFSNNYALEETDAQVITTWIDTYDDRNLYMEGGDTWAFDAPTSLHAYFNINGVLDGSGDLANIDGIDLDWAGMDWGYAGENNWIDNLEAISPAVPVLQNPDVGYYCGIAYNEGSYRTVGASFEVTGVVDASGSFNMGIASIMSFFGYDVFAYGDLEGTVTEAGSGDPIEDATVSLLGEEVMTNADGEYLIEDILVGTWTVFCSKDGYNPESADVTIEEDETTVQDFTLTSPDFNVDPTSISVTLDPNGTTTESVTIDNPGTGTVNWSASLNIQGDNGEDMFDLIFDLPVGIGGGEAGIETDGTNIYTSKWNGVGEFYRYAMDGTYLETITVTGSTGCRDIAYDGTYFYGGAASTTIFEMDLANATMISTFTGPAACRAIGYNHNEDAFYCNNWSDNIVKFDKAGANLGSFPTGPVGVSYYGFAYEDASGGEFLWGYAQTGATLNELVQIELPSGVETGLTFDVGSVAAVGTGIAGGLAIDDNIESGVWAFLGTAQNVNLWALELAPAQTWISIDPTNGTLDPGGSESMDVMFDATGLLPGFYYADINFSTSPNVGSPTIEVELEVAGLIPAINLMGTPNCLDVDLSWEMPSGGTPDSWNIYRDGELIGNVTEMNHTDPMLDPETEYCYTVTAVYGSDESLPTLPLCMTMDVPEDLEPLNPDATHVGAGDIVVSWEEPAACLLPDEYDVYRDGEYIGTTTDMEYTDPGLTVGFYEYYVVAIYYFGESGPSDPAYVLVGIDNPTAAEFQIYPNPASDLVNVKSVFHVNTVEVLNNAGQVVYTENVESTSFNVNVSDFERGIYYFRIQTDDGVLLRKIAVK